METSILIARIIAVIYLSMGVGFILNRAYYQKEFEKMIDNSSFMLFGGMMAIVIGSLIIGYHNVWVKNWTILITIIGWISLTKGVILLAFPRLFHCFRPMVKSKKLNLFMIPGVLILGFVFAYFGFCV